MPSVSTRLCYSSSVRRMTACCARRERSTRCRRTEKRHEPPPSLDHLVGAGEPCRWDPETYALARWSPHTKIKPNRKCT